MSRVAAIDCGTNSVRLLVADVDAGRLLDVTRRMHVVRLGQDVDRTGRLAPEAIGRTIGALREYAAEIAELGADRVRMVATSATRDAANREEFVRAVVDVLGIAPEVVSGAEEAALSFAGATAGVAGSHPGSYLVADIGGGSTEIVLGDPLTGVTAARSVDVGCVRLTERCLRSDPPTATEVEAAEGVVEAALDLVDETLDARSAATFVGLAGSVTTVAAIALGLPRYDPVAIHGRRIAREDVERVTADLLRASRSERAAAPVMHPGRVDVIGGGALVLRSLLRRYDLPAVVASESDILDGIALSLAR